MRQLRLSAGPGTMGWRPQGNPSTGAWGPLVATPSRQAITKRQRSGVSAQPIVTSPERGRVMSVQPPPHDFPEGYGEEPANPPADQNDTQASTEDGPTGGQASGR